MRSLAAYVEDFRIWVLCMDDRCFELLGRLNLPNVNPIRLADFEKGDDALLSTKNSRTTIEYYFTCTPSLPLYIFTHWKDVDVITYLDSDLWFFSSPEPLYRQLGSGSISIIGHSFPAHLKQLDIAGVYNVGWLTFKRDNQALACLKWWRNRCIEWCYDRFEDGKFADQKYLDEWPHKFEGVRVLDHKGANLAPWNLETYKIAWDDHEVRVDGEPLIFFHFHGLKQIGMVYDLNLSNYQVKPKDPILKGIYRPYLLELAGVQRELEAFSSGLGGVSSIRGADPIRSASMQLAQVWKRPIRLLRNLWWREYVFVFGRRVFWL